MLFIWPGEGSKRHQRLAFCTTEPSVTQGLNRRLCNGICRDLAVQSQFKALEHRCSRLDTQLLPRYDAGQSFEWRPC